jgi:hypothetical protein
MLVERHKPCWRCWGQAEPHLLLLGCWCRLSGDMALVAFTALRVMAALAEPLGLDLRAEEAWLQRQGRAKFMTIAAVLHTCMPSLSRGCPHL